MSDSQRKALLDRAVRVRAEIEQIFIDCALWNDHVRRPFQPPIDPDPEGQLRRVAESLDRFFTAEAARLDC